MTKETLNQDPHPEVEKSRSFTFGAYPEGSEITFVEQEAGPQDLANALAVKEKLSSAGFGFDKRPWLVCPSTYELPENIFDQIRARSELLVSYLPITESILNQKFGGNPMTALWGLPSRGEPSGATIVRFDDILTPVGKLIATELEGWSSGQGQIAALRKIYTETLGARSSFMGMDVAAVKTFHEAFGVDSSMAILVPPATDPKGFCQADFEVFSHYCRQSGYDIFVEEFSSLEISSKGVFGKGGKKLDVIYPFFTPAGYVDTELTSGMGPELVRAWSNGQVELFPEPSWLQSKLISTIVFDPAYTQEYLAGIASLNPDLSPEQAEETYLRFQNELFGWSWPLDPEKPPIVNGQRLSWEEFFEPHLDNVVYKPLFSTEATGLVFPGEKNPEQLKSFMDSKLASYAGHEPYPTNPGEAHSKQMKGTSTDNDYRSYLVQEQLPHLSSSCRYLNPRGSGVRTKHGFSGRFCTTIFLDGNGGANIAECDVTLRNSDEKRIHGARNSVVTVANVSGGK